MGGFSGWPPRVDWDDETEFEAVPARAPVPKRPKGPKKTSKQRIRSDSARRTKPRSD